ncbi:MAG: hypothetical protein WD118_07155 [Phycisphaeraceae bacterium]
MKSGATLSANSASENVTPVQPIVFIDGVPEPRLAVVSYTAESPLDMRSIVLDAGEALTRPRLLRRWQQAHAIVAQPMRLADEQVRWQILGQGAIDSGERTSAAGRAHRHLTLHDRWTKRLADRLAWTWWSEADGALVAQTAGRMQTGSAGNRSHQRFSFTGREVFVLREAGEPWLLGEALATVNAWAQLNLSLDLLPAKVKRAPLIQAVDLGMPLGTILRRLLEPYGLFVQREILRDGETVIEWRAIRDGAHSRTVHLSRLPTDTTTTGHAKAIAGDELRSAAEPWVARGAGWRVESTFDLVPGWHPTLAGASDAMYARSTSDDFVRYGKVYRYWVLNEDGRFSDAPYEQGPAFDLATFFGEGNLRAQALPFRPCVTRDEAGEPKPAIVEVSTDEGDNWQQYPGRATVAEHRAAVYLDDDELPSAFFTAVKAGEARVRVTASLQNPQPVEVVRWRGNPFAGANPPRVFEVGEVFRFQRVASSSIHAPAIAAGELEATELDSRQAMQQWLVERLHEQAGKEMGTGSQLRLTLAGTWLALRPGDRLHYADETHGPALGEAQPPAAIQSLRLRFDRATTELDLRHASQ